MKLAASAMMLVAVVGCSAPQLGMNQYGEPKSVIVEVTIEYPDASATEVKQLIAAPLAPRLTALADADQVTTICGTGEYRAYITAMTTDESRLVHDLDAEVGEVDLPAETGEPRVTIVESVPQVQSSCRARVVVDLDQRQLARLGLTADQVKSQIPKDALTGTQNTDQVGQIVLRTPDNEAIRLADVANLYLTCGAPDTIVKTHDLR